jgi:hypothetical protein
LRGTARGGAVAAVLAFVFMAGTTAVLADCGEVSVATVTGQWQLKETVAGYTPGPRFAIFKPAGFQNVDNVTFTSTCSAAGQCAVGIAPNATGGNFRFNSDSPIEFAGPDSSQPMTQDGANIAGTYATTGGIGGPGLPKCSPPKGYIDASTTFHVVSAVRDAQGAWHATLITGTFSQTAGLWSCQGGVGVDGAIENVVLEAVPVGSSFPAQIPTTCASAKRSPAAAPPGNPNESSIASALSTPGDAFSSLSGSLINAAITVGIILFITFPSQLFNHTFEENYDEIRAIASRRLRWLRRLRREASATTSTARSAVIFGVVVLAGAVLGGLNDPKFGFNGRSAITYLAVILAILVGVTMSGLVNYTYRRARGRDTHWEFHALPAGLLVAATCVLISRLSAFQPGYLYGVIAGIAFGGTLARDEAGHNVALGTLVSLIIAVLAWFAWVPVHGAAAQPGAGFLSVVGADLLASLFIGGLVGSVIGLLPLSFLPGGTLLAWSRAVWAAIFGLAVFGLLEVELRPQSTAAHPGKAPIVTAIVLFVLFGGASVGLRVYFNTRKRRATEAKVPA